MVYHSFKFEYLHRDRSSDEMFVHSEITDFVGLSDT